MHLHYSYFRKNLKYEDDEAKENSVDSITKDNTSESLEIEADHRNTDMKVDKVEANVMKTVEVDKGEGIVIKEVETEDTVKQDEVDATRQDIKEINHKNDDHIQNQEQNGSGEEQKENGKTQNNNEVISYKKSVPDNEKCNICGQFLNNSDIIYYQGHPQDAVEEYIALTNEKLVLASGQSSMLIDCL